jgi:hypothetical protein
MDFVLSHWHCVVPVVALLAAALLMRRKKGEKNEKEL